MSDCSQLLYPCLSDVGHTITPLFRIHAPFNKIMYIS